MSTGFAVRGWAAGAAALLLASVAAWAADGGLALRYQEAWYQENGLNDLEAAVAGYRAVAEAGAREPALAAKSLLRMAACYRQMGQEAAASQAEERARQQFGDEIRKIPTYRLEVLHKQLDDAFDVTDAATASQAIVSFLGSLEQAAVHSICESCYGEALKKRQTDPLGSIPAFRKAIAISTYLEQFERSAFHQKDIGDIYAAAGRYDEAIAAYRKIQENFPQARKVAAWAQVSIAEAHRLQGHLADAVEAYRGVESTYPGQTVQALWASLWMGDAFRVAGKLADARAAWRRALEEFNEPAHAEPIAVAALLLGQADRSGSIRIPENEFANDVAYFLAVAHEMGGEPERARRDYQRCIDLSKGNDWPRPLAVLALETGGGAARP